MLPRLRLLLVVALGVLMHAPSLGWDFFADDYGHQLILDGEEGPATMRPWSLYDFGETPLPGELDFERGSFPWWTEADWKVRFFRPVASLSLMLDHALFGDWAPGYHLSALVLFALLLVAAHALYRALGLSAGTALLATLLLGLEDGGVFPVGWPANRNTLVEALFVVLALLAALRGERVTWRNVVLAGAAAVLAALSKESGLVAFPLVALVLLLRADDEASRRTARLGTAALFGLTCAYLGLYVSAGYGAHSAFYPTPWGEPAIVARRAAVLFTAAPAAMLGPVIIDVIGFVPGLFDALVPACAALSGLLLLGAARLARRAPITRLPLALALLALLPQAGAPISDRLVFVPMIGFAPLVALWIERWRGAAGKRRLAARSLWVSAVVLSGLVGLLRAGSFVDVRVSVVDAILGAELPPAEAARADGYRDALFLNSPHEFHLLVPVTTLVAETDTRDARLWPLQMGRRGVRWTRVDERTFDLRVLDGAPFGRGPIERVFLAQPEGPAGTRWSTALFDVEALGEERSEAGLRAARFRLRLPLEHASLAFLAWSDGAWRRVEPPAVGDSLEFAAVEPIVQGMP